MHVSGAGPNEAISKDPLKGYGWTVVNKSVNGLVLGCPEIVGFEVVQLEQQDEGPATGKLAEDEHRIAFKNSGTWVGLDVAGEVNVPKTGRYTCG